MNDKQKIVELLKTIGNLSDDEIAKFDFVIDKEIKCTYGAVVDENKRNDERILSLIVYKILYSVALTKSSENSVKSFSALDISISEDDNYLANAKALVDNAYKECVGLISDDSFAFLGV